MVIGWKGSGQVALSLAFDLRPGLTLQTGHARLDYDLGSDLVTTGADGGFVSTRIATGEMEEYRLAVVASTRVAGGDASAAGRQRLGIESIETGRQSSAGIGTRMDYRLGRSGFTVGADLRWMWKLGGNPFVLNAAPDSPYLGTTVEHEGLDFLDGLSCHF